MTLRVPRFFYVAIKLLPFILSVIRDWRAFVLFGAPRLLTERQHLRRAEYLRRIMGELGPSFIKAAQVLAMRSDMLLPIYTRELKKLQDQVPPFPYRQVRQIVKADLGRPVEQIFDHFDPEPIAAASLGQVHKARYKGRDVAVKVLRPGVEQLVSTDLAVIKVILKALEAFIDDNLMRSFEAIASEFDRMIRLEMDFRNERRNADRLRENFRNHPMIRVPRFIPELCTRSIAVSEFVEGVRIDHVEEIRAMGVDTRATLELLMDTYIRMTVIHGFIHADPHPGNLFVDREGRLVILDHGMVLEFGEGTRLELLRLVYAVTRNDVDAIVDGYYKLGMVDPGISRGVLRDAAQTLLEIQLTSDVTPRQVQEIAQDIINTFYKFPLRLPNNLVYLLRASSLVEGIAFCYDPNFNGVKEATPVVKRMLAEIAFGADKPIPERLLDVGRQAVLTARDLALVIQRLEREQLRVGVSEADLFELERFLNSFLRRLLLGLGLITLALVLAIGGWLTGNAILLISSLAVFIVLFSTVALIPIPKGTQRGSAYFK